jgi:SAM-dependent methyltransferase
MVESVRRIPAVEIEGHRSSGIGNERHPMRIITRQVAGLASGRWDSQTSDQVVSVFDELASEWHTRTSPQRTAVVEDALSRGFGRRSDSLAVEVGAGIGTYSGLLVERFDDVLALDISLEMTRLAPGDRAHRVLADGADLPVRCGAADAVVMINAFLFPAEVARVLRRGGVVIWVNSSGGQTPIHLSTDEVVSALPFPVDGVEARAGVGTWCVLTRIG